MHAGDTQMGKCNIQRSRVRQVVMESGGLTTRRKTHTENIPCCSACLRYSAKLFWQRLTKALNLFLKAAGDHDESRFPRITLREQLLVALSRLEAENVSLPAHAKLERRQPTRNESHYWNPIRLLPNPKYLSCQWLLPPQHRQLPWA